MHTQEDTVRFKRRREAMVRDQLGARGIRDQAVLSAMEKVPRHFFVGEALRDQAYDDHALPIGFQQTISQPWIVARMTEALLPKATDRVLEIGTGSGYQAVILSEIVAKVYTIERIPELYRRTRALFDRLHCHRIVTRYSDGTVGWKEEAPFNGILVTAGGPEIPEVLLNQLAEGGRLVIPIGTEELQELVCVTRKGDLFEKKNLGPCRFVKLVGAHGWKS